MKKYLKQLFCKHKWVLVSTERYDIIGTTNFQKAKVGEVTITIKECGKCEKNDAILSDKKYL